MRNLRIIFVISMLMALTVFFSRCFNGNSLLSTDPRGDQYAGANACMSCHQSECSSYTHSNHYRTSSSVNVGRLKELIASSNKEPFYFSDSSYVRVEENNTALFQSSYSADGRTASAKFDIAFGSGEKAQTYGYWKDDKLYQLPLTWYTSMHAWANSPGFSPRHARYERTIGVRCFECHASYANRVVQQTGALTTVETLDKASIVYGIDCERCHGPALQHVKYQQENPSVKTAKYIVPITSLTRQQQLDVCAVCHSGNDREPQWSLFAFAPGDTLSHFYFPDPGAGASEPDVHGKQIQLLQSSRCFIKTAMTCTTCHSPHTPEDKDKDKGLAGIVAKCMDCHQGSSHATGVQKDNEQKKRDFNLVGASCIDCHMPLQTSKTIYFNNGGGAKDIPYLIRTHKIGIYK